MIDSYLVGLGATALLLFIGHWFPWPAGDLDRLAAYVYGVGAILAGQAIWLLTLPGLSAAGWQIWLQIASFAVVGGGATGLAYLVDWVLRLYQRSKINERRPE